MAKGKAVRDSKSGTLAPAKESRTAMPSNGTSKVEVSQGNIGQLTVQFLNGINNHLYEIKQIMERLEKKIDG